MASLFVLRGSTALRRRRVWEYCKPVLKFRNVASLAATRSSPVFDPWLMQRGIDYERRNGFVNVQGEGGRTFHQFMLSKLQTFSQEVKYSEMEVRVKELIDQVVDYEKLQGLERSLACAGIEELLNDYNANPGLLETINLESSIDGSGSAFVSEVDRPSTPVVKRADPCLAEIPGYAMIGIDFETNGVVPPGRHEVVEIAAANYASGSVFHSLVNPGSRARWSKGAEETHKIAQEDVMNPDVWKWNAVWDAFLTWLKREAADRRVMLIAHNGFSFDFRILLHKSPDLIDPNWTFFDTLKYARYLRKRGFLEKSLKQEVLMEYFNLPSYGDAHRADSDIVNLGKIFQELLKLDGVATLQQVNDVLSAGNGWCFSYDMLSALTSGTAAAKLRPAAMPARVQTPPVQQARKPETQSVVKRQERVKEEVHRVMETPCQAALVVCRAKVFILDDGRLSLFLCEDLKKRKLYTPALLKKLEESGLSNLLSILKHLPREYIGFTDPASLPEIFDETVMFKGVVTAADLSMHSPVKLIKWQMDVTYGTQKLTVFSTQFWGRSPIGLFAAQSRVQKFPPGSEAVFVGKVKEHDPTQGTCTLTLNRILHPHELGDVPLLPVYPDKKRIKSYEFQNIAKKAIDVLDALSGLNVYPEAIMEKYQLGNWLKALFTVHRPASIEEKEKAVYTIKFHDMMCLHALLLCKSRQTAAAEEDVSYSVESEEMVEIAKRAFGYTLTEDQQTCLDEILDDMQGNSPMLRILQGDVGTGKTIIALIAMFATYGSGFQSALMVPTEILGQQHHHVLQKLVRKCPRHLRPRVALLTSATKKSERTKILGRLQSGEIDMLIGTHSLFNKEVAFQQLGLVIVDEQHKFGVEQRQKIKQSYPISPHMLMMSATPIPRSMALIAHGTIAISSIKSKLPGKQDVDTYIIHDSDVAGIDNMFSDVVQDLEAGGRAYMVFPCINESESVMFAHLKSVKKEYEKLSKGVFAGFNCGFVHGKMSSQEKNEAFSNFAKGVTHVLMSTTVIEVGMDVQQASVMIVYHPERFGLAQLHQLRGRVGRGHRRSTCYLIPPRPIERLQVLQESTDGETIAQADLQHRGPGDLLGSKQSGFNTFMTFPLTDMLLDDAILTNSKNAATDFLDMSDGEIPTAFGEMMKVQGFPSIKDFEI